MVIFIAERWSGKVIKDSWRGNARKTMLKEWS